MKIKQFFIGFKEGTGMFSHNIGLIVNSVLLSIVYFIGIGFTSIAAKISGKKFLELRTSKKSQTYWSNLNLKKKKIERYYRQF
jgi:hypothetical protein